MNINKKLFLSTITEEKKLPQKELLAALIPHDFIYAHVENATLSSPIYSREYTITDLPIPEMYLQIILARGFWTGNKIELRSLDAESGFYKTEEAEFSKEQSISFDDLFVYEDDFLRIEREIPVVETDLNRQCPISTTVMEEESMETESKNNPLLINFVDVIKADPDKVSPQLVAHNYLLIGILLDFIVGTSKDLSPKNQSELVSLIVEKYYDEGVKSISKRNLDEKFGISNKLIRMLNKAEKELADELKA